MSQLPESYGYKHIERRIDQLFQELGGEGNLAAIIFNMTDGKIISFHRGQRWVLSTHEFGVEIRRAAEGVLILYGAIVSIHMQFGHESTGGRRM